MMFNLKWGYWRGYADGLAAARDKADTEWERTIACIREELSDVRRDRDLQMARADAAADLLLQHLGTRAISLAGKQEEVASLERKIKAVGVVNSIPDPTDDLPLGDPRGSFKDAGEASLFS